MERQFQPSIENQKVFGRKHALTIEAVNTRSNRGAWPTLQFEFASATGQAEQGGAVRYDWQNKLAIQLKPDHLPLYAAVLLGDLQEVRFDRYGGSHNKTFAARAESGRIVIKGLSANRGHAVPAPPERVYWLIAQAIHQLRAADDSIDSITIRAMIRRAAELTNQSNNEGAQA